MSFFRKPRVLRGSVAAEEQARAAGQLREEVSALEHELTASTRAFVDLQARADAAERRAMEAVQRGDETAARAALLEHGGYVEKAAEAEADLHVLRAILDECYQLANELPESPPASPRV